jgi:hypothetical protein
LLEYTDNLDRRIEIHQQAAITQFVTNMQAMRTEVENTLNESIKLTNQYLGALGSGIDGLNGVLTQLGEKQVVIQQVKKKGWFSRDKS